jgi:aspartokinase
MLICDCMAQVSEAVCLPGLSYHEAWELSYFGANVLHPRTTLPAMKYSIPISIRNFFNQAAAGTVISDGVAIQDGAGGQFVKGFATIDNVSLINVEVRRCPYGGAVHSGWRSVPLGARPSFRPLACVCLR